MSDPQSQPLEPPPFLALVGVAVAVLVLHQVPLFGVDREALAHSPWGSSTVPLHLAPLALVSLGVAPRTRELGGRALLALAVLAAGGLAFRDLSWLSHPPPGLDVVVLDPGMGTRLLVTLTATAVHALLLFLAARLDGPRVHGLWWVIGVSHLLAWLPQVEAMWWSLEAGEGAAAFVFGLGLVPALLAATAWAALDSHHRWIRSFADAFGLSLLPAVIVADGLAWSGAGAALPGGWSWLLAMALLVPGLVITGIAVQSSQGFAPLRALAVGLPSVLALVVAWGLGTAAASDVLARMAAPGPFEGEVDAVVPIHADDPGPDDVEVLRLRMLALGIGGTIRSDGDGEAVLELRGVSSVEEVLDALLPRRALTLRGVIEEGHDEPLDVTLEDHSCWQPPCPDLRLGVPRITGTDVAEARVAYNDFNEPQVMLTFTSSGAQTFADWTETMIQQRIAIVVDDRVMSVPMVRERIPGGSAVITMGNGPPDEKLDEAVALSVALRGTEFGGHLQGHWSPR